MAQKKYTDGNGVSEIWLNIKNYVYSQLLGKADYTHTHTKSEITDFPTIPTVNNATLTIQKNGTNVATFTSNSNTDVTANISVPTKTSDLTNDSGFITSDNTKIPLAGSNQISGDLIPATNNTYNLGSNNHNYSSVYAYNFPSFMRAMSPSDTTDIFLIAGTDIFYGAYLQLSSNDSTSGSVAGSFRLTARDSSNQAEIIGTPSGTLTWNNKNVAMQEDVVPRSGGAVMTGGMLARSSDDDALTLCGGTSNENGASIAIFSTGYSHYGLSGSVRIGLQSYKKNMYMFPNGTWTWDGTACQITSDQRFKQQISEIDDKLLDAWADVELCQFKYNDAVSQKKDKARLHTGYVVQQIDNACKKHDVDISTYGLYCHEEYPQETEEVEIEQADGTKTKERKVIREASEHYSLRYTEALIVECKYLRRCIARLTARIEELEKGNNAK